MSPSTSNQPQRINMASSSSSRVKSVLFQLYSPFVVDKVRIKISHSHRFKVRLSLSLILLNPFLILILLLSPRLSTVPPRTFQTQLASLSSAPATALPAYVESLADASSKVNQALGGEPKSQQRDQVLDWLNRIDKDGERITEDLKVSKVNREEKMGEI